MTTAAQTEQPRPALRVAFVIASLGFGGAQRALANMVNRWSARGGLRPEILVLEAESAPAYPLAPGVGVRWLGLTGDSPSAAAKIANNLRRISGLRGAIREARPDVVVAFQDVTNVLTLLACLGTGLPVVASERVHPARHRIGPLWGALRRLAYPLADALVVQGRDIARWFPHSLQRRIRVIPNPVPRPAAATARPAQGERRTLLAAGRLHPQKGFDLLLDAFARLAGSHPDWDLAILGEGPERGRLEAQAQALGLADRVRLPGALAPMDAHYLAADVFVLPSRFEGFPNALAEAMAHGVAVLAADCPGAVRDLVRPGVNGLLAPAEDVPALARALALLFDSPGERLRLGAAAREVARRFDEDAVLDQWEQLLRNLCRGVPCT